MSREIPKELVLKVAHLARIRLTDEEVAMFARQLGEILHYVEILEGVDTEGVEPMAHAADLTNVFRDDEPGPSLPREDVMANAPKTDGEYFLVPQIIENAPRS